MIPYAFAGLAICIAVAVVIFFRGASRNRIADDFVPQSVLDRIRARNDV